MRELWTKQKTAEAVGYHAEHLMRLSREGTFPRPVKLGATSNSAVRFVAEEIEAWISERMAAR